MRLFTSYTEAASYVKMVAEIKEPPLRMRDRLRLKVLYTFAATLLVLTLRELVKNRRLGISRAPGSTLLSIADFLFSRKTNEEITRPIIADMQFEYNEALFAGRKYKAKYIRARGLWTLFFGLGLYRLLKLLAGIFVRSTIR